MSDEMGSSNGTVARVYKIQPTVLIAAICSMWLSAGWVVAGLCYSGLAGLTYEWTLLTGIGAMIAHVLCDLTNMLWWNRLLARMMLVTRVCAVLVSGTAFLLVAWRSTHTAGELPLQEILGICISCVIAGIASVMAQRIGGNCPRLINQYQVVRGNSEEERARKQ